MHIPATGPLDEESVSASLATAAELMPRSYPEHPDVASFWCRSWLLDPQLPDLVPGSNVARFQQRWETWGAVENDRDGFFFAFDVEPDPTRPPDLDTLPTGSRLHRALVELWRGGGHVQVAEGTIPVSRFREG